MHTVPSSNTLSNIVGVKLPIRSSIEAMSIYLNKYYCRVWSQMIFQLAINVISTYI